MLCNQCRTVWLSDQNVTFFGARDFSKWLASLAPTTAAITSNLGIVIVFNGATLFLAIAIADLFPLHKYATAQYE